MGHRPDATPAKLWHYVEGGYISPLRVSPRSTLQAILRGNLQTASLDVMIAVTETAKIINRITDKNQFAGA